MLGAGENNLTGLFPPLVKEMIEDACGSCRGYKRSTLHYFISKTGSSPHKENEYELKQSISPDVDVSFPIYGMYLLTFFLLFVCLLQLLHH